MITRIFFATDVHGSEVCWMKFINAGKFYKAGVIILGGDVTGKAVIPLIRRENNFETSFLGKKLVCPVEKIEELEKEILDKGCYPYRTNPDEVEELKSNAGRRDELFLELMTHSIRRWMRIADERLKDTGIKCFVCPGNDDMFEIDPIIEESEFVIHAENKVIAVDDHHEMISVGWTNPTPWNTFKECCEEELYAKIEKLASQVENVDNSIFNLHAPPYGSGLDEAPKIDEKLKQESRLFLSVGSTAVMDVVQKYQPLLGLHGHIHEGRGFTKIGLTLCINPGSSYDRGVLLGVLINVDKKSVKSYFPVIG